MKMNRRIKIIVKEKSLVLETHKPNHQTGHYLLILINRLIMMKVKETPKIPSIETHNKMPSPQTSRYLCPIHKAFTIYVKIEMLLTKISHSLINNF